MNRVWIIERSKRNGQLCNRLGLFAHFVAHCIENQDSLINLNFSEYASGFENLSLGLLSYFPSQRVTIPWNGVTYRSCRLIVNLLKNLPLSYSIKAELKPNELLTKNLCNLDDLSFENSISQSKLIFCQGWRFRCFGSVSKHAESVKEFFRFNKQLEAQVLNENLQLRNDADLLIAVHMRLGDYKNHLDGRFYYKLCEYKRLMQKAQNIFYDQGVVKFIIFSNEKQYSDDFNGLNVAVSHGSAFHDLCLMSKCDYILGPPSSFSNWASFYGDKPLLYILDPKTSPQLTNFRVHLPLEMGV